MKDLFYCIKYNNIYRVKELLANESTDVNERDGHTRSTPLIYAIEESSRLCNEIAALEILKHPNIDVNAQDGMGNTALMLAAWQDLFEVVSGLLEHKNVDVNSQGMFGMTALMLATRRGNTDMVAALLKHKGIHVDHYDCHGNTALDIANLGGHIEIRKLLEDFIKKSEVKKCL